MAPATVGSPSGDGVDTDGLGTTDLATAPPDPGAPDEARTEPEAAPASPDPSAAPTGRSRARRAAQALLYTAPVAWILVVGWTHRWMTEDGFIYLRIVRQIRAGNGPVFNAGERAEGYTGVLWVALLSIADLVTPIRLEWLSVGLGLALTAAGVALALAGASRLWAPAAERALLVPLGAVAFVAVLPVWAYATSGLETGLVFGWLGWCLWILASWARDTDQRISAPQAVVLGLGWLVRPEMVIFSAAFVLVVLAVQWRLDGNGARLRFVTAALAIPVAYQVFRMGYFGSLVPNTAIAKEGSATNWDRGMTYLTDFTEPYWLWVPLVGLLAGGYLPVAPLLARARDRRRTAVAVTFVGCALANTAYVVAVGGDYHHARMFLPAFFAICAPVAVVPATRNHLAGLVVAAWAVVAMIGLRPEQYDNILANGILAPRLFGDVTTDDIGWGKGDVQNRWYTGPALYHEGGVLLYVRTDFDTAPGLPLPYGAFWGVGVAGYAPGPDFHVLDLMGLADPLAAHMENQPSQVPGSPRYPGHEKPLPSPWVAARVTPDGARPDPADFPSFGNPLIAPTEGAAFQEQVAWARAALRCDGIQEIMQAADAPLTPRRFARNLLHAAENTRTRIPPDPEQAYHRFCGAGTPPEVRAVRSGS